MSRKALILAVGSAFALVILIGISMRPAAEAPSAPAPAASPATAPLPERAAGEPEAPTAPVALAGAGSASAPLAAGPSVAELERAAGQLRGALVNIICTAPYGSPYHSLSASGVFITNSGYILTSAHVAASFLLAEEGVSCVLRTGSPARPAYFAELAYLPAPWVRENAHVLTDPAPSGTGQYDFALLAVLGSAIKAPPPPSFPAIALGYAPPRPGTPVMVGTYGAQALSAAQIESALAPTIVPSSIKMLYTFGSTTVDILELSGSAAAQEGSSGGGVLGYDGTFLGAVTTSTVEGAIASRSLSAVSAAYIRREYEAETGAPLDALLALPPASAGRAFSREQAPALTAALLAALR